MTDRNTDATADTDANGESDTAPGTTTDATPQSTPDPQSADGDVSPCYQAHIERNDHRPDSCTIYSSVTAGAVAETWITATGSAFVSRDAVR